MTLKSSNAVPRLARPGLRYGHSPERAYADDGVTELDRLIQKLAQRVTHRLGKGLERGLERWLETGLKTGLKTGMARCLNHIFNKPLTKTSAQWCTASGRFMQGIERQCTRLCAMSVAERAEDRQKLADLYHQHSADSEWLINALAHSSIALQDTVKLTPRANQLLAARELVLGRFVEMDTGEGKTLSIALAAGALALSGAPIHVLTANDYLAQRDAEQLASYYRVLGHRCGFITSAFDDTDRRSAYACDIVYVTGQQVAFDWLKDELRTGREVNALARQMSALTQPGREVEQPLLRGLCLAIVDEADSVLIDEARTPVVLASERASNHAENADAVVALSQAEQLHEGVHFSLDQAARTATLTEAGHAELEELATQLKTTWSSHRYRTERVRQALVAIHLYVQDVDYVVRDKQLKLLDVSTGRVAENRKLPHGLHRLLELKEKCSLSNNYETVASIPVQAFFRRYLAMAGTSGTLDEVSGEIYTVYGIKVIRIDSHRPCVRRHIRTRVFRDNADQLQALIDTINRERQRNRPILIGTRSVDQSLAVSAMLDAHGFDHQVLNAYQDKQEAGIIAKAGHKGQLTVATNMAGRGTDIAISTEVNEKGGLHVVSLSFQDSARLERQLFGRSGRQGDQGSSEQLLSLDDPHLTRVSGDLSNRLCHLSLQYGFEWLALRIISGTQKRVERQHRTQRLRLFKSSKTLKQALSFSGIKEHLA